MNQDLTKGNIARTLLSFAFPMMVGNLLQQLYNIADTLIVGQFIGKDALAAVGSSFTLMTFLNSILLGLCMGSGILFSICFGKQNFERLRQGIFTSFWLIGGVAILINLIALFGIDAIMSFLQVPEELYAMMRDYLWMVFWGIGATFLYNYFASLLRAVGNSVVPLVFLGLSALLNIGLDILFVLGFSWGVRGAAIATVLAQCLSCVGIAIYTWVGFPRLRVTRRQMKWDAGLLKEVVHLSFLTCVQQSVMNFGIMLVQGLVNSFGPVVMAAFAAAVKIDAFAYMPVQDFGNAFSTFVAQNHGAKQSARIQQGIRTATKCAFAFCLIISGIVCLFAKPLLLIFIQPQETEVLRIGMEYLWIEGPFYCLIGFLFLFYGYYRAMQKPGMSVVLTVISLGSRVALAYALCAIPEIGVSGIWAAVPIGWCLADLAGLAYYRRMKKQSAASANTVLPASTRPQNAGPPSVG